MYRIGSTSYRVSQQCPRSLTNVRTFHIGPYRSEYLREKENDVYIKKLEAFSKEFSEEKSGGKKTDGNKQVNTRGIEHELRGIRKVLERIANEMETNNRF